MDTLVAPVVGCEAGMAAVVRSAGVVEVGTAKVAVPEEALVGPMEG